ncbi:hypothetical protein BD780_002963 [Clostridium tetanomorphum]|uniref:Uncharacterized protein n=1 Tax=Clostridium tetanomorphum TaxID=1553 RepID=A0A923J1C7_CLOTT|nr:hypothetical protein [Clostridium tetanomorphum]MBC2397208.1 hypothetical protein [Clostridium tetanomorphum]MBP1862422.1 hypothetical protein [Clostridium tetanomorphum]NRS85738.1 hypothetical protein [Clostridium tetanomorphum]NRZ96253.1 hypothetical protein [Clostridium tetanomorphum]SQC02536.1 Uncharacterised protein [Clostridium tetanomorphum]
MLEGNIDELKLKAKKMLIDGKTMDEIRRETRLREKDIKRIQSEITAKF